VVGGGLRVAGDRRWERGLSARHCVRVLHLGNEPGMQSIILASHCKRQIWDR